REEDQMAGEHATAGIDPGANRLRDAEDDAADERPPERTDAADDDRLESEDQARRAGTWIEGRRASQRQAGERDRREGDSGGDAEHMAGVDAGDRRGLLVVGRRSDRSAHRGAREKELQADENDDRRHEDQEGHVTDG